jgi:CDP-6-deoxy-D-xylo-4-hexulose-3-dehydrase
MKKVSKSAEEYRKEILHKADKFFEEEFSEATFIKGISKIPVSGKVLYKNDLRNLISSSLDMWLTSGRYTELFEKELSKFVGTRHSLFVNSGSSANLVALSSLKILHNLHDGDEVITSAVNFPTTINPIIQNNLKPVFVDVDFKTMNIDANLIEEKITTKTKGIVLAHTLGNPFDLEQITKLCMKYDLFLMEDMCDALGSTYGGKNVGTFGDVSTLSFYPAHHITTGEGGAVLTSNPKLKKIMESMRDWGRDCYCKPGEDNTCKKRYDWQLGGLPHGYDHKYIYSHIGYNLKATDMQASIGLSQISKIDYFVKKRKENYKYLFEKFKQFDVFDIAVSEHQADPSWFGFPLTINNKAKFNRTSLLNYYAEHNIGTRLLFAGNILLQPAYFEKMDTDPAKFPVANIIAENSFWLGCYPGLNTEMLDFVVEVTDEFIRKNN